MSIFTKLVCLVLSLLMLISVYAIAPITANAETSGDYEYVMIDDNTVEITKYIGSASDLVIPGELDGKIVTCIGAGAFTYCSNIESVTIPNSVNVIGNAAFYHCSNLIEIKIPYGVSIINYNTFNGCSKLTYVNIPDSVTEIGDDAFAECNYLFKVNIPDTVTRIGNEAFLNCNNLDEIVIPASVKDIGERALGHYEDELKVFGYKNTSAEEYAKKYLLTFIDLEEQSNIPLKEEYQYSLLENGTIKIINYLGKDVYVDIPETINGYRVSSIGEYAFSWKQHIHKLTIPSSVNYIEEGAFLGCTDLTHVYISEGLKTIGEKAFLNCDCLKQITIPDSVEEIGTYSLGFYVEEGYGKYRSFIIYGYVGSKTEEYANKNEFEFIKIGVSKTNSTTQNSTLEPPKPIETQPVTVESTDPIETQPTTDKSSEPVVTQPVTQKPTSPVVTTPTVNKKTNTAKITVKTKTVKAKKLKSKKQTVKLLAIKNAQGKVMVSLVKKGTSAKLYKKLKVSNKCVITIKKGKYKKGTYKVKIKIIVKGNSTYKSKTLYKTVKVKIK